MTWHIYLTMYVALLVGAIANVQVAMDFVYVVTSAKYLVWVYATYFGYTYPEQKSIVALDLRKIKKDYIVEL